MSQGNIARAVDAAWRASPVQLPADGPGLDRLFGTAWEDGFAAIGLLAGALPDAPAEALAQAEAWLERTDDLATADAIGWMILGPARIAQRLGPAGLTESPGPLAGRAAASAGLAWLPIPLEGPSAAGVRARLDQPVAMWVSEPDDAAVATIASALVRDREPFVQKALRRLVRSWGTVSRDATLAWAVAFPGGLPRLLGDEILAISKPRGKR